MTYTSNFNLNLPEGADQFDIAHWNHNTEKIDSVLGKEISDREKAISGISESLNSEIEQRQRDFTDAKNLENATGVLSVSNGGTGKTTLNDALNAMTETSETLDTVNSNDLVLLRRRVNDENKTMNTKMDVLANKIYELLQSKINTTVPLGVIYPFAGEFGTKDEPYKNVPVGYLACDGQEVSRTEYASLFALIGTKYGNGDEINTFNVPDLRECVMVGAGQSTRAILDTTGHAHDVYALGEFKDDQIQDIGKIKANATSGFSVTAGGLVGFITSNPALRTGATTHGKQVGINYIIKY